MDAEHIPTTYEVRAMYVTGTPPHRVSVAQGYAEFDAWLTEHDREVQARALEEAAAVLGDENGDQYRQVARHARDSAGGLIGAVAATGAWLAHRAARLRSPDAGVGGGS